MKENSWHRIGCPDNLIFLLMMFWLGNSNIIKKAVSILLPPFSYFFIFCRMTVIYIRPFPGPGGKWQVSTSGGIRPRWRGDGKELFFMADDSNSSSSLPAPPDAFRNKSEFLLRSEAKAIILLSGDHTADASLPSSKVNRVHTARFLSYSHISRFQLFESG